jgi:hypothetical protein
MHWVVVVYKVHGMGVVVSDRLSGALNYRECSIVGMLNRREWSLGWMDHWSWRFVGRDGIGFGY